ncbi:MAG: DivIVA domain-containing protein [Desulfobacterales bacterium]|nr:DivIVA domain-containing protein [Desulfobacterales bacterium]
MNLTPLDIQQKQFNVKFRGFDILEVDNYLEQMASAFEALQRDNKGLHEEIQRLKQENRDFKEREETFKRALQNSQKVLEQMKENAQNSAKLVIADAEVKAEKILNRAYNRLAQLHEDIGELKRQRVQIQVQVRAIIDAHTKMLELGNEEMKAMDEEDSKLTVLKQPK